MKVSVTFEIADREREAIQAHYGAIGKASRERVESFLRAAAEGELEVVTYAHENKEPAHD